MARCLCSLKSVHLVFAVLVCNCCQGWLHYFEVQFQLLFANVSGHTFELWQFDRMSVQDLCQIWNFWILVIEPCALFLGLVWLAHCMTIYPACKVSFSSEEGFLAPLLKILFRWKFECQHFRFCDVCPSVYLETCALRSCYHHVQVGMLKVEDLGHFPVWTEHFEIVFIVFWCMFIFMFLIQIYILLVTIFGVRFYLCVTFSSW